MSKSKLATLRDYIKINLIFNFIQRSSNSIGAPILFIKKKDNTLYLIINYKKLNFITIKNHYSLPLISDILNYFIEVEIFTKLNFITIYNKIRIKKD